MTRPWKDRAEGIPQGLPVSGVLANIYMLEFDEIINAAVKRVGGLNLRYSDDFILICPTSEGFRSSIGVVARLTATVPTVVLHEGKTKAFRYEDRTIEQMPIGQGATTGKPSRQLDYLGFTFDGSCVKLRQRTIGRYYRRMYHRIKRLYGSEEAGKRPSKRRVQELYFDFSDWGIDPEKNGDVRKKIGRSGKHGNFLTCIRRAQSVFPDEPIRNDVAKHKLKIRRRSEKVLRESEAND